MKMMVLSVNPMIHLRHRASTSRALKTQPCAENNNLEDVVTLCKQGRLKEALHALQVTDYPFDSYTYITLLQGCIKKKALAQGKLIHAHMKESGYLPDIFVENTVVNMYTKCGSLEGARRAFDQISCRDAFSWTVMIAGYAKRGYADEALTLFHQMQRTGIQPDAYTFASVLPACSNLAAIKEIHEEINRWGFQSNAFVGTALVDGYAKCESVEDARDVFDKMPQRDSVLWNAMIVAYSRQGLSEEALRVFYKMRLSGILPNEFSFASVLQACVNLGALEQGMKIHGEIIRSGFMSDLFIGNGLVDMYAKCGSIEKARELFDNMHHLAVDSWNAMITGYAMNGHGKEALKLFEQMKHSGMSPNHVTMVSVLCACSHAGLVHEGYQYFNCMKKYYNITPAMEHYMCMVDLLGRAGLLDEAKNFINKMPIEPDPVVWICLLGACRVHNNIELGEWVANCLFDLDPKNATPYVLLSNVYAAAGRWNDIEKVRKMMNDKGIKKTPGCSWIEINKEVHGFLTGDRSHPQTHTIYKELERLSSEMKVAGYVPDTTFVLNDVKEEEKEQILCHHSERLAIVFGLLNIPPGTVVRVVKNLRVCGDCHTATKFISKIVAREIVVRDANRYHHFKGGQCSCGDYW